MIEIIRLLGRIYDRLIDGLAAIACTLMAAIFLSIIYDVTLRNLGFKPPAWTSATIEYSLLFITMFTAPWLVRERAHVYVETATILLPPRIRYLNEKFVYVICIISCLILAYFSLDIGITSYLRGDNDFRSIEIPKWILLVPLPIGFGLVAVEFARFLFSERSYYATGQREGY